MAWASRSGSPERRATATASSYRAVAASLRRARCRREPRAASSIASARIPAHHRSAAPNDLRHDGKRRYPACGEAGGRVPAGWRQASPEIVHPTDDPSQRSRPKRALNPHPPIKRERPLGPSPRPLRRRARTPAATTRPKGASREATSLQLRLRPIPSRRQRALAVDLADVDAVVAGGEDVADRVFGVQAGGCGGDRVVGEVGADEARDVDCGRNGADAADDQAGGGAAAVLDGDGSGGADDGVAGGRVLELEVGGAGAAPRAGRRRA